MCKDIFDTQEGRDIGLSYLYGRGVTEEAVRKFNLGYALDKGSALTSAAKSAGYDINILKSLGLVGTSKEGRVPELLCHICVQDARGHHDKTIPPFPLRS